MLLKPQPSQLAEVILKLENVVLNRLFVQFRVAVLIEKEISFYSLTAENTIHSDVAIIFNRLKYISDWVRQEKEYLVLHRFRQSSDIHNLT